MNGATVLPEVGYVRLPTILQFFPVGRSTWWAGVKSGKYPPAHKISAHITAWKSEDIRALLQKTGGSSAAIGVAAVAVAASQRPVGASTPNKRPPRERALRP